jgi:hypothetical protein
MWFARESFQLAPEANLPFERFNDEHAQKEPMRLAIEFSGPLDLTADGGDARIAYGTWRYEIVIGRREARSFVASESLRQRADGKGKWSRVFERMGVDVQGGKAFALSGLSQVVGKVRDNASLVSTLAQFDHKPSLRIRAAAGRIASNILFERLDASDGEVIEYFANNPAVLEALNRNIGRIDLGIRRMVLQAGPRGPVPLFEHVGLQQPMPWILESHGTQNFIKFFPLLDGPLSRGGMAVIDELDTTIHPALLPEIIRWFHDPERNPHRAQLWMTCHSAPLLEELRKEEIFFTEKDSRGRARIHGLRDIQGVKRADNHYRKYLSGEYGGLPIIG